MNKNQQYEMETLDKASLIEKLEKSKGFIIIDDKINNRKEEIIKELCELDTKKVDPAYLAGELKGLLIAEKYRKQIKMRAKEIADKNILEEE